MDKADYFCWLKGKDDPKISWVTATDNSLKCTPIYSDQGKTTDHYLCVPQYSSLEFTWVDSVPLISEDNACFRAEMFTIEIFEDMVISSVSCVHTHF